MDYKKDGKYEIILGNVYYDEIGTRYQMLQFGKGKTETVFDITSK